MGSPEVLFRSEVVNKHSERLHGSIVLGQPRSTTYVVVLLGLLMTGFLVFALLGQYARTETVRGILTTDRAVARVGIVKPGVVSRLFAQEGQVVAKGDPLLRVDVDVDTSPDAGSGVAAASVRALDAESNLRQKQSGDIRGSYLNAGWQLDAQIADHGAQAATLAGQVAIQEKLLASSRDLFQRAQAVSERGFLSVVELERRRQVMLQGEQQLANLRQQAATARAAQTRAQLQKAALDSQLSRELAEVQSSVSRLERERAQMSGAREFVVTAPVSGTVTALQLSEGQAAIPGISAMAVVPRDAAIEAQLFAPSRSVGQLRVGQQVNLLVDAFPYQRFGNVKARVTSIAATMIDPRQVDAPFKIEEPVFKVRVRLEESAEGLRRRNVVLQPGMTLMANIVLERRSFMQWLLSPLSAVTQRNS